MKQILIILILILYNTKVQSDETKIYRVYHKLNKEIIFIKDNKELIILPSGTRILGAEFEETKFYYVFDPIKKRYERVIIKNDENILVNSWPAENNNLEQTIDTCKLYSNIKNVFINEAEEALHFSKEIKRREYRRYYRDFKESYPEMAKKYINSEKTFNNEFPEFSKLIDKVNNKLEIYKNKNAKTLHLDSYGKSINKNLPSYKIINKYKKILFKSFNPIATHRKDAKKYSDTTIYNLFNLDFVLTNYNEWYRSHWRYNAINPLHGNSGEGFNSESLDDKESDWYRVKKQLFSFSKIVESKHNAFISHIHKKQFENNERIIFMHNNVFKNRLAGAWRDYIPVDQSTSCFISDGLLSTLIHESNVNSGRYTFFPDDTHAHQVDITYGNFLKYRNENFHKFKYIIAREPYIHLIYLDYILTNFLN